MIWHLKMSVLVTMIFIISVSRAAPSSIIRWVLSDLHSRWFFSLHCQYQLSNISVYPDNSIYFKYVKIRRIMGAIITYASFGRGGLDSIQELIDKPNAKYWPPFFLIAEPWGLYLSRMNYNKSCEYKFTPSRRIILCCKTFLTHNS